MSAISRRKMITRGLAAAAGLSGLAVAATHRRSLRAGPARSRRHLRTRRDADLCRAAAPHSTFARARIQPQPDLEAAVRQRNRAAERSLQAPSGRRLQGLAARRRRPRRAAGVALARRASSGFRCSRQITEIACEEGWSYIAEWIGTPLADVLRAAGIMPQARYVVYFSIERRLVGQHRHGRCAASADAARLRDERRRPAGRRSAVRCGCAFRGNSATRASSTSTASP